MKHFIGLLVLLASIGSSVAAEQSKIQPETEILSATQAFELANALANIGGTHDVAIGQGASQRAIATPYDLSTETRWAIADNVTALRPLLQSAQDLIKAANTAAETKNGGPLKDGSPEKKILDEELQKISDTKRPVAKLFHIHRGELKLNVNAIPVNVLSVLAPIIDP